MPLRFSPPRACIAGKRLQRRRQGPVVDEIGKEGPLEQQPVHQCVHRNGELQRRQRQFAHVHDGCEILGGPAIALYAERCEPLAEFLMGDGVEVELQQDRKLPERGEGKTFARSGTSVAKTMTVAQMTNDGIAVADYVRHRLHRDRIILLGHSWGSILGMHMVHARPDLFSAYVGTGQIVKLETDAELAYPLVLAQARRLGNRSAEQELLAAGPPPYPAEGLKKWAWVKWANDLDTEPHTNGTLTPAAIWLVFTDLLSGPGLPPGAAFSQETMWSEMLRDDLPSLGLGIKVPVVFIQGEDDRLAVTALAKRYFDRISAPRKKYVELPGAGHLAIFYDREAFLKALVDTVIPLELPERAR